MNCCATVQLRYYGNATGCIGHVTKENPICHNIKTCTCKVERKILKKYFPENMNGGYLFTETVYLFGQSFK
jgi:hypothetical protein